MNKKFVLTILAIMFSVTVASAATNVKVKAHSSFNTASPAETMSYVVEEDVQLGNYSLLKGDILNCNVLKVTDPKRGKRDATFYSEPTSYIRNEEEFEITEHMQGKYSKTVLSKESLKEVDKAKVAKKAAVSVSSYFVKAIGPAVSMTEGMIKNEEGGRIKSGVKQVYKDSPISYAGKGKEVTIEPGDEFYLVFKIHDNNSEE